MAEQSKRGGFRPGAGRPKGSPNKVQADVKAMILGALSDAGGRAYLTQQALENPSAFMVLVGKVLPLTIAGDADNPVTYVIRAPSPVESASEWLKLHAPSDAREPTTIDVSGEEVTDETSA